MNGDIGVRHRLTQLEIVDSLDFNRFSQLDVTADMQVAGDFTNPEFWEENEPFIGEERSDNIIPIKSLYNAGARITLSSDWDGADNSEQILSSGVYYYLLKTKSARQAKKMLLVK